MAVKRSTDPVYLQYIWNTIEAAPNHGISTNFQSLLDFIQTNYDQKCTTVKLERELMNALSDGCLHLEQRMYRCVNLNTIRKGTHDWYCFECHGPGHVIPCPTCHRAYHHECLSRANETHWDVRLPIEDPTLSATSDVTVQSNSLSNSVPSHPCPVCQRLSRVDKTKTPPGDLQNIFSTALDRIRNKAQWKTMQKVGYLYEPLRNEVLVYSQVNTRIISDRMRADPRSSNGYSSRTSLLVHLDDLVHNTTIFYGVKDVMSNTARQLRSQMLREMRESAYCIDCYMRPASTARLTQACRVPHLLIWYQHNGWSFRPCKVLYESKDGYEVVCFGGRHEREFVSRNRAVDISFTVMDLGLRLTPSLKKALDETEEYKANQGAYNMKQPITGTGNSHAKPSNINKEPQYLFGKSVSTSPRKRKVSDIRENRPGLSDLHRADGGSSVEAAVINKRRKPLESQRPRFSPSLLEKRATMTSAAFGSKPNCAIDSRPTVQRKLNHTTHLSSDDDTLIDSLDSGTSDTDDVIKSSRDRDSLVWPTSSNKTESKHRLSSESKSPDLPRPAPPTANSGSRNAIPQDLPEDRTCKRVVSPVRIQCDNSIVTRLVKPQEPVNTSSSSCSSSSESDSEGGAFIHGGDSKGRLHSRHSVIRIKTLPLRPNTADPQPLDHSVLRTSRGRSAEHPHSPPSCTTMMARPQEGVSKAVSPSTSSSTSLSSARSSSQLTVPAIVDESLLPGRAYESVTTANRKNRSDVGHSLADGYEGSSHLTAKSEPPVDLNRRKPHDPLVSTQISSTKSVSSRRKSSEAFPSTSSNISSDLPSPSSISSVSSVSSPSSPSTSSISSSSVSEYEPSNKTPPKKFPVSKIRFRRLRPTSSKEQSICNQVYHPSCRSVSPTASTLSSPSSVNNDEVTMRNVARHSHSNRRHRLSGELPTSSLSKSSKRKTNPMPRGSSQQPASSSPRSASNIRPVMGNPARSLGIGASAWANQPYAPVASNPRLPQSTGTSMRSARPSPAAVTPTTTAAATTTTKVPTPAQSTMAMSAPRQSGQGSRPPAQQKTTPAGGRLAKRNPQPTNGSTTATGPTPPLSSSSAGSSCYSSVSPTGLSTTSGLGSSLCDPKSVDASPAELAALAGGGTAVVSRTVEENIQRMHEQLLQARCERDAAREEVKRRDTLIDQLKSEHADELRRCKQQTWCNFCYNEAFYHCCLGTAYCSESCQLKHWAAQHNRDCRRRGESQSQPVPRA